MPSGRGKRFQFLQFYGVVNYNIWLLVAGFTCI